MAISTDKAYLLGKAYALGIKHGMQNKLGMDEEPARWITVNGNKVPVDKDGNPLNETGKIALGKKEPPKKQGKSNKATAQSGSSASNAEPVAKEKKSSQRETKEVKDIKNRLLSKKEDAAKLQQEFEKEISIYEQTGDVERLKRAENLWDGIDSHLSYLKKREQELKDNGLSDADIANVGGPSLKNIEYNKVIANAMEKRKGLKVSQKPKETSSTPKSGNSKVDAYIERAQNPESDYIYEVKNMSDKELKDIYNFTKKHQDLNDTGIVLAYSAVEGELGNRARKQGKSFNDEWSRMVRGEVELNRDKPKANQKQPSNQTANSSSSSSVEESVNNNLNKALSVQGLNPVQKQLLSKVQKEADNFKGKSDYWNGYGERYGENTFEYLLKRAAGNDNMKQYFANELLNKIKN